MTRGVWGGLGLSGLAKSCIYHPIWIASWAVEVVAKCQIIFQTEHERFAEKGEKVLEIYVFRVWAFRHGNPGDSETDLIFQIRRGSRSRIEVTSDFP